MTSNDRIEAALAALDKATPGEWTVRKTVDTSGDYPFPDYDIIAVADWGPQGVAEAYQNPFNAILIARSPDLAAEVIRLRKLLDDMVGVVKDALYDGGIVDRENADRLIAEAKGE